LIDEYRSGSPVSMPDHPMGESEDDPEHRQSEDVDMQDAFPAQERKRSRNPISERVARRLASVNGRKEPVDLYSIQPPPRRSS
jgi:hypothetical protein